MSRLATLALTMLALAILSGPGLFNALGGAARPPRAYLPAVGCAGCAGRLAPTPQPPGAEDTWSARFVQLVNARRAAVGCPAVTWSPALARAARSIATTWTPPQRWSRAVYGQHGYSAPVVDAVTGGTSTPEQAVVAFEREWGVLNAAGTDIIPSPIFASCHRTGGLQASYDLGVGLGDEHIVVALAEDFFEARMVDRINAARLAAGCPAAAPNAILMRATGDWSAHLVSSGRFEHSPFDWYSKPPYSYWTSGVLENITGGAFSAETAFEDWIGSPLHRRNLEWCYKPGDPSYHPAVFYEIGIGYDGGIWTLAIADRAP
ncbi:MAG TPA: CAP domain-containing protein [Chloroflexaceae bacterium]|nr:CAP domain-containing protein [Chloroflexaceae bacterium]